MDLNALAGKQFVFGRMLQGQNLNLATQRKVTFRPDGRIDGGPTANEHSWRVDGQGLFFSTPGGVVSTRFDREITIGNCRVWTGVCLAESAIHFLFPYVSLNVAKKKIRYVISSHVSYTKALDILLPQLTAAGVAPEDIWVTMAASDRDEVQLSAKTAFSYVRQNAYEYTGLLDASQRMLDCDYVYLLHDTCHVGPKFRQLAEEQPGSLPIDYLSAISVGYYNIGLYRMSYLQQIRPFLQALDGVSKERAIDIEMNRKGESFKVTAPVTSNFLVGWGRKTGLHQPYSKDNLRNGIYLVGADVHKFYGMPNHWMKPP